MPDNTLRMTAELRNKVGAELSKLQKSFSDFYKKTSQEGETAHRRSTAQSREAREHTEKLKREYEGLQKGLRALTPAFAEATEAAGGLTLGAIGITGAVVGVGAAVVEATRKLGEFSEQMQALRNTSRETGFSITQLKELEQVGARFGVTVADGDKSLKGFAWSTQLAATNYQGFRNQLQQAGFGQLLAPMFNRLMHNANDTQGALHDLIGAFDQIRARFPGAAGEQRVNWLAQQFGLTPDLARMTQRQFDEMVAHVKRVQGPDYAQNLERASKAAEEFHEHLQDTYTIFDKWSISMKADLLPSFDRLVMDFNEWAESPGGEEFLHDLERTFKDVATILDDVVKALKWLTSWEPPGWLKWLFNGPGGKGFGSVLPAPGAGGASPGAWPGAGADPLAGMGGGIVPPGAHLFQHPAGGGNADQGGGGSGAASQGGGGAAAPQGGGNAAGAWRWRRAPWYGQWHAQHQAAGASGSGYLQQQRQSLVNEMQRDPGLRDEIAGMAITEGARDPVPVIESLANRMAYTGRSAGQLLHSGFYGPINRGQLPGAIAQLHRNPALERRMYGAIDTVTGGSNITQGSTDQGLATDPNGAWIMHHFHIARGGNIYGDWAGGPGGHAGAEAFRQAQQAHVREHVDIGTPTVVDRDAINQASAPAHVEGTGQIDVNVNAPQGTRVAAKSGGIFKRIRMNRNVQMQPAASGPADIAN